MSPGLVPCTTQDQLLKPHPFGGYACTVWKPGQKITGEAFVEGGRALLRLSALWQWAIGEVEGLCCKQRRVGNFRIKVIRPQNKHFLGCSFLLGGCRLCGPHHCNLQCPSYRWGAVSSPQMGTINCDFCRAFPGTGFCVIGAWHLLARGKHVHILSRGCAVHWERCCGFKSELIMWSDWGFCQDFLRGLTQQAQSRLFQCFLSMPPLHFPKRPC